MIVVLLPCSALAEPPAPDYARTGPYIGAEGVVGIAAKLEDQFDDFEARVDAAFDVKIANDEKIAKGETWFASGNVKGFVLTGRFQPFVLVGAGYYHAKYKADGISLSGGDAALRAGGGFDAYVTEHVVVTFEAEYVLPFGEVSDLDYTSVGAGLEYRF
jgi:opacity protein-like surface antigen